MTFPVDRAVWDIFMDQCMCTMPRLTKDDEELRRILKNPHVRKIQKNLDTVPAQNNNSPYRGMHLVPEWCDDNWILSL